MAVYKIVILFHIILFYDVTYGSSCNFLFTFRDYGLCCVFLFSGYLDYVNSTKYCTERHTVKIVGCSYQFVLVLLHRRKKFPKNYFIWCLAKLVAKLKWLYAIPVNI